MKRIPALIKFVFLIALCASCSKNDDNEVVIDTTTPTATETSATVCENGFAGEYPCNDYNLMSKVPLSVLSPNANGNDIWGWTDPSTEKEYALVGTTNSTAFVDISNPLQPVYLGRLNSENGRANSWRDIKVYNNHAFIVADAVGNHGMQVFDLTKLREVSADAPQIFSSDAVYSGIGSCHNIVINESNGIAYLVGCDTASGGPVFVDISTPTNPQLLGTYSGSGYTHDAQVVTYNGPDTKYKGKEILIASNGDANGINKVIILDVTSTTNPQLISETTYTNAGYAHQGWFTTDQRFFILGDELDETRFGGNTKTLIFDFSSLEQPTLKHTYFGPTNAIDHNGYVKDNLFYLANYTAGFRVLDISGIANNVLTEIGFFDTHPDSNSASFNGVWSVYPYFKSGTIIINDIENGLFVIKKKD